MSYNNKWSDRRDASGSFKPRLFLFFEVLVYVSLLLVVHYTFHMLGLTLVTLFVALYFFITSSLVRYRKVMQRQKFSKYK
ncbi:MAG: hypothetical protein U9R26_01835 [Campylobacterota bacterium]|nr:hypothetical protein [Campylobacterota bacterium]